MGFAHVMHATDPRVAVLVAASPWRPPSVGLYVTYTRAAWLAAILGIVIVAGLKGRRYVIGAVVVLLIVLLTVPGMVVAVLRPQRGDHRSRGAGQLVVAGARSTGPRPSPSPTRARSPVSASSRSPPRAEEGKQPHNDFLRAYVEMGVVGHRGAYLWLMWQLVNTGRRAVRVTRAGPPRDKALAIGFLGCAAGYVLMCFVANLMSQVVVGMYFAAFAACAAAIVTARDGWREPEDEDEDDVTDENDDQTAEVETMRVLHVNKFLHRKGGAEGYMLDLADLQRQHGHEVAFYGMDHPNNDQVSAGTPASYAEFDPAPEGVPAKVALAARMIWSRQAAKGMEEAIAAFRPDVVHAHNIYHQLSPSVVHAAARHGVPVVLTMHDYKLACPTYKFLDNGTPCTACITKGPWEAARRGCNGSRAGSAVAALEVSLHRRFGAYDGVRRFISPSRFLADQMIAADIYPDRIRVQSNFTDLGLDPRTGDATRAAVFAGRLSSEKGVDTLIRAVGQGGARAARDRDGRAARHRRRRPGACRAGGPGRPGRARSGPLPRPHGPGRPAGHDPVRGGHAWCRPAGTRTSRWRCSSRSPWACRCSAPTSAGCPEMVDDETGWVVPANDDEAMAAELVRALADPVGAPTSAGSTRASGWRSGTRRPPT